MIRFWAILVVALSGGGALSGTAAAQFIPPPLPQPEAPLPTPITKVIRPDARGWLHFVLECPSSAPIDCKGSLTITTVRVRLSPTDEPHRILVMFRNYDISRGTRVRLRKKASADVRTLLRRRESVKVRVRLKAAAQGPFGANESRGTATLARALQ